MPNPRPDVRREDGTIWQAGYKDEASAIRALFDATAPQFFFLEIEPNPDRRWWSPWRPRYRRTGRTWEGSDMRAAGFTVIPRAN